MEAHVIYTCNKHERRIVHVDNEIFGLNNYLPRYLEYEYVPI